jgi:hypothetical protein
MNWRGAAARVGPLVRGHEPNRPAKIEPRSCAHVTEHRTKYASQSAHSRAQGGTKLPLFGCLEADPRNCSMKSTRHVHTPDTRRHAATSLRFLTRLAAVAATGATVVIGIVVAKEHPGASASSSAPPLQTPSTSTTVAPTTTTSPPTSTPASSDLGAGSSSPTTTTTTLPPTTTSTSPPTTTTTRPVATSGGTRR